MGSGKTHWGRQLASKLQIPFFDLDEVISQGEKKSIADIFSASGEEYFRMRERETLSSIIDDYPSVVLSTGGGTPCFFNNIEKMKKYGIVVWLNTDVEILMQRLMKEKAQRPLIRDIPDEELKTYIIRKLNKRRMYYELADIILDNESDISTNAFIQTIIHA
jgi:shikimate kinase